MRAAELDRDGAEQRNQTEGAEAGDAAALGKLAILPSALEAHQQADREGDREPPQQMRVFRCHALVREHWVITLKNGAAAKTISIRISTATTISRVTESPIARHVEDQFERLLDAAQLRFQRRITIDQVEFRAQVIIDAIHRGVVPRRIGLVEQMQNREHLGAGRDRLADEAMERAGAVGDGALFFEPIDQHIGAFEQRLDDALVIFHRGALRHRERDDGRRARV